MPRSDKNRLYVALYVRGSRPKMPTLEDTYHWSLITGPKNEEPESEGWRFHAKDQLQPDGSMGWQFEERHIPVAATQMLLVRVLVGKIADEDKLKQILRGIPVRADIEGWNCVHWIKEALEVLKQDGKAMGTSDLNWTNVRNTAMEYVQKKKDAHRFDGKGNFDMRKAATYDLLEGKETIP